MRELSELSFQHDRWAVRQIKHSPVDPTQPPTTQPTPPPPNTHTSMSELSEALVVRMLEEGHDIESTSLKTIRKMCEEKVGRAFSSEEKAQVRGCAHCHSKSSRIDDRLGDGHGRGLVGGGVPEFGSVGFPLPHVWGNCFTD